MVPYKVKSPVQIRFVDNDMLRHVNATVYYTYFEVARGHFFDEVLTGADWKEQQDLSIVIAHSEMDYKQQLRFRDEAYAYVWISSVGTKSFEVSFLLVKMDGGEEVTVAEGKATMVCINLKTEKTLAIPEDWKQKFNQQQV